MTAFRVLLSALALSIAAAAPAAGQPTCLSDHQCADGDLCNGIERCVGGTCAPATAPLACDDGDPCTTDTCNPAAGCAHADVACPATCGPGDDGVRCSDGTACTVDDTCAGGSCVGAPLACDDGDPCTADTCDIQLGCVYQETPDPPACLSSSQCASSADHTPCVGDGDPCTQDGCLEGACRVGLNQIQRQCADADLCNGDEFCSPVKGCEPGPPLVCDDGALCNGSETCAPATGCVAGTPAPDGTSCDDGQACTEGDVCNAGTCTATPLDCSDTDPYTSDFCLEPDGCLHCTPLIGARLMLRLPAPTKAGRLGASGKFIPATSFVPTGPAGVDLVVHDGSAVTQRSHVPGSAFSVGAGGRVARFADKSGTVAPGLERLRVKTGAPGDRHQFTANGPTLNPLLDHATTRSLTLQAGATCATTTLACSPTAGGQGERCK